MKKSYIALFCFIMQVHNIQSEFYQSGNEKNPPTNYFGLYIILHNINGKDISQILQYYSQLKCPDIVEIQIFNPANQKPKKTTIQQHSQLFDIQKGKVEIYLTLKIEKKEDTLDCKKMQSLFLDWKNKSQNHLDFVGAEDQAYSYSFSVKTDSFSVEKASSFQIKYFAFFDFHEAFIPYDLMKMYQIQRYQKLRQINKEKDGKCSPILLAIAYAQAYPQNLPSLILRKKTMNKKNSEEKTLTKCLNQYYTALQYNPLRLMWKMDLYKEKRFQLPFKEQVMLLKESYYEMKYNKKYLQVLNIDEILKHQYELPRKSSDYVSENGKIEQKNKKIMDELNQQILKIDFIFIVVIILLGIRVLVKWVKWRKKNYTSLESPVDGGDIS